MEIKNKKHNITVEVEYTFPESVNEAENTFSSEVVLNRFNRQLNQELRACVTRKIETEIDRKIDKGDPKRRKSQDVASEAARTFKPTMTSSTSRATKTIDKALAGLSEEQRANVLAALTGNTAGAAEDFGAVVDAAEGLEARSM